MQRLNCRVNVFFYNVFSTYVLLSFIIVVLPQNCIFASTSSLRKQLPGKGEKEELMKHVTYRGSFLSKGECVKQDICRQRCYTYVLEVARSLNTVAGEEGYQIMSISSKEKIMQDTHVCSHGCCFRAGTDYEKCSAACHKFSYVEKKSVQSRWYNLCTKGCFDLCPSISHAATDSVLTIAPPSDEPLCDSTKSLIWGRSVTHILPDVKKFTDYTQKTNQKLISQVRMNEHEAMERL